MCVLRGAVLLVCLATSAFAQDTTVKLRVDGQRLIYNTTDPSGGQSAIEPADVGLFLALVAAHPDLSVIELTSVGGSVDAAWDIADIVRDYDLDTHVHGDCDSSCVTIFLSGKNRSMASGARLGFHQVSWAADDMAAFFERNAGQQNWDDPWQFSEWLFLESQLRTYRLLNFMVSRGVDPGFAIQSMHQSNGAMWRPHRVVLRAAGVLTD